jgi:hypothetical protein
MTCWCSELQALKQMQEQLPAILARLDAPGLIFATAPLDLQEVLLQWVQQRFQVLAECSRRQESSTVAVVQQLEIQLTQVRCTPIVYQRLKQCSDLMQMHVTPC